MANMWEISLCSLFLFSSCVAPKHRFYPKFADFVNDYDEIMTENLTKSSVDHRNIGLASHEFVQKCKSPYWNKPRKNKRKAS